MEATPGGAAPSSRDRWVDLLRAGSLAVVVLWHWVFTIIVWQPDGPHATNPIGTTRGLWLATWLFQVMPLFFLVGGAVHALALARDPRAVPFIVRRAKALLVPALLVLTMVAVVTAGLHTLLDDPPWLRRSVVLLVSPLWFLAVYLLLVTVAPLAWRAHQRWGELVPVWLAGTSALIDVARFKSHTPYVDWLAWIAVFGAAHQAGFFWPQLQAAPRRLAWIFLWLGLFGLLALTNMGFYPRSTVGVPTDEFSNLGPPTVVIVMLALLQLGVALLVRDRALALTSSGWPRRAADWITTNAQILYFGHAFAYAVVYGLVRRTIGHPATNTTWRWWLARPFWLAAPALVFAVGLWTARRVGRRSMPPSAMAAGTVP